MKKMSALLALLFTGCVSLPENVTPVSGFKLEKYLGTWYEVARLDHSFERGLSRVTAEYSLREDGGVRVLNRGYLVGEDRWKEAEGKAYFVDTPDSGFLKVSFFGPFYGAYVIFELDQSNYRYALIAGPDKSYLWLLARTPRLEGDLFERLVARASALGFDTRRLICVNHDGNGPAQ